MKTIWARAAFAGIASLMMTTAAHARSAPKIWGTPPTKAVAGTLYDFQPVATDSDGDKLRFGIDNKPAWATFDSLTGRLRGTPASGNVGTYSNIRIKVSDGRYVSALPTF
ncbi:MAG: putative Ig domain-containing protein, partial [Steroidobacteraceae bacterium]